jgi:hypothetical protein
MTKKELEKMLAPKKPGELGVETKLTTSEDARVAEIKVRSDCPMTTLDLIEAADDFFGELVSRLIKEQTNG